MIRNIIFGGCSLTWGQSLHYHSKYTDDEHPRDGKFYSDKIKHHHYQYMVDNRFTTKVADYFGRKPIVRAMNGGDNCLIVNLINEWVNDYTDAIIIQTTGFGRCKTKTIYEQMQLFLEIIKKYEKKGIIIRFLHWDIDIEFIPNEILKRTIYFEKDHSFWNLLMDKESKYTIEYTFNVPDKHLNQSGHNLFTEKIIKELDKFIKKPIYN